MTQSSNFNKILVQSQKILKEYDLCENCLGRLFSKKLRVSSNMLLGKKIRKKLKKKTGKCYICKNLFSNTQSHINKMIELSSDFQFSTFLTGTILKPSFIDRDDLIRSKFQLRGIDSIKTELTRDINKKFRKKTKKKVDFKNPDVTFTINLKKDSTEIMSKPICLFGRYTKKIRGIKQKQKLCENCEGEGCRLCDYHGISKFDSVEGIICDYLFKKFGAKKAKFTWIGGEDKKSLVLGKGRPFFVKMKEPKKRKIKPTKKINLKQIDILDLNIIDQIPKEPIKFRSKIVIKIITEDMITSVILANLKSIKKTMITVSEKSGKESDKVIYKLSYRKSSSTSFNLCLTTDGGLPIKRFVEGNYVNPSISSVLGIKCKCKEFDFHDVEL